jgi:hypothetical protein
LSWQLLPTKPVLQVQVSPEEQMPCPEQTVGWAPLQIPPWQVSVVVHALPSSHGVPSGWLAHEFTLPQTPDWQLSAAFGRLQTRPHAPQFDVVFKRTSQPFAGLLSQSPQPALQAAIAHVPPAQVELAFGRSHTAPQTPQLDDEFKFVSHPFAGLPSQSPKPALQVPTWHAPLMHAALPFWMTQSVEQEPQLVSEVFVFTSQPSAEMPLQLAKPELHDDTAHVPPTHAAVAFKVEQTLPQLPQLDGEIVRLVSQPSEARPLQSPQPALHEAIPQPPFVHIGVPFATVQTLPHAPQFWTSARTFFSQPSEVMLLQFPKPALQLATVQVLFEHPAVPLETVQTLLHAPQLFGLLEVEVSQPSDAWLLQLPKPGSQDRTAHVPLTHASLAFCRLQTLPHAPQLEVELRTFVSQPFDGLPSQSLNPALHEATWHVPLPQVAVAFGSEHATPHAPQLPSVFSAVSQPFAGLPSQLLKPALHAPSSHVPLSQVAVAFGLEHAVPHAPQLPSVFSVASQPFAGLPSQSLKPALHDATWQVPLLHVAVAFGFEHVAPHAPQLPSVLRALSQPFAALPSQLANPGSHDATPHTPQLHISLACGEAQTFPHAPQLPVSLEVVAQKLPQSASDAPQHTWLLHVTSLRVAPEYPCPLGNVKLEAGVPALLTILTMPAPSVVIVTVESDDDGPTTRVPPGWPAALRISIRTIAPPLTVVVSDDCGISCSDFFNPSRSPLTNDDPLRHVAMRTPSSCSNVSRTHVTASPLSSDRDEGGDDTSVLFAFPPPLVDATVA